MAYNGDRKQIFLYHGYANGVGGTIERNGQTIAIPSIGGAALSSAGGEAFRETGRFEWVPSPYEPKPPEGFSISVDRITTSLWTEENAHEWITNAEVRVYGFNLCERVKIGLMVNQMTSRHPKGPREELADNGQPHISFAGSQYWNVYVDGESVHVTVDHDLDKHRTHDNLKAALGAKDGATEYCPRNLSADGPDYMRDLTTKYRSDKYTRCSIVGEIRHKKAHGYSIDLTDSDYPDDRGKNLGRVFLGEMLVGDEMKHLNMIRWDLGCNTYGGGTAGSVDMNGLPMP